MPIYVLHSDDAVADGAKPVREAMFVLQGYIKDQKILEAMDLSLTEAYGNAARHAYPQGTGPVDVVLEVDPGREVILEVADWGKGLTGIDCVNPDSCTLPGPGSEGGRGFYLINQSCDRVTMHTDKGRHAVRMALAVPKRSWRAKTTA